jgi:hypothetical protein
MSTALVVAVGFPDDYSFEGASKSNVGKLLGNAVPVSMAAGVVGAVLCQAQRPVRRRLQTGSTRPLRPSLCQPVAG